MIVSLSFLVFIFSKIDIADVLVRLLSADLRYIIYAILFINIVILISSMRWRKLVNSTLASPIKHWESYQINLVASFFNLLSPGRIFGDAYRAYYIYKLNNNTSISIIPLIMDRFFIFGSTIGIGCISIFWMSDSLLETVLPQTLIGILSFGIVSMPIILWFRPYNNLNFLKEFYEYIDILTTNKSIIFYCLALSILMILALVGFFWSLVLSLGLIVEFKATFIILVLTILISSIPITISGLGLRDSILILLLSHEGVSAVDAITLSLLWYGLFIFSSLPGLVLFFYRKSA